MATRPASKKAAPRKTAAPKRTLTLNGRPAKNPHFPVDVDIFGAADARASDEGLGVPAVLRAALHSYSLGAPKAGARPAARVFPADDLKTLRSLWDSREGEGARVLNEYLTAARQVGWPLEGLAQSLVASGAVEKMSRQAILQRVQRAGDEIGEDVPTPPGIGARTVRDTVKDPNAVEKKSAKKVEVRDLCFRVDAEEYDAAVRRVKSEGGSITGWVEKTLFAYANHEFDVVVED